MLHGDITQSDADLLADKNTIYHVFPIIKHLAGPSEGGWFGTYTECLHSWASFRGFDLTPVKAWPGPGRGETTWTVKQATPNAQGVGAIDHFQTHSEIQAREKAIELAAEVFRADDKMILVRADLSLYETLRLSTARLSLPLDKLMEAQVNLFQGLGCLPSNRVVALCKQIADHINEWE